MQEIKMKRAQLLEIVKKNRDTHRQVFLEALDGYRKAAVAELERSLDDAKAGRKFNRSLTLIEPMDMTKTYDQAIQMLELHTQDEIEIQNEEFRNYVLDEWHWTKNWATSNQSYASTQMTSAYLAGKAS